MQMIASIVSLVQKSFKGTGSYVDIHGDMIKPQPTFMFIATVPASIRRDRYSSIQSLFTTCYIRLPNQRKICEILVHRAGFLSQRICHLLQHTNIPTDEKVKMESIRSNISDFLNETKQADYNWFFRLKHLIKSMTTSITNIDRDRTQSIALASTMENSFISNFGKKARQIMLSLDAFSTVTLYGPPKSGKSAIIPK